MRARTSLAALALLLLLVGQTAGSTQSSPHLLRGGSATQAAGAPVSFTVGELEVVATLSPFGLQVRNAGVATGEPLLSLAQNDGVGFGEFVGLDLPLYEGYSWRVGEEMLWWSGHDVAAWESHLSGSGAVTGVSFEVGTKDAMGRRLNVTVMGAPDISPRVLRLTVDVPRWRNKYYAMAATRVGMSFSAGAREGVFGLGERFSGVNLAGKKAYCWTEDGGWGFGSDRRLPKGPESTYSPVPFYLSERGHGVWVNSTRRSDFDFAHSNVGAHRAEVEGTSGEFVLFMGRSPAESLKLWTAATGRSLIPPKFQFGPWNQFRALKDDLVEDAGVFGFANAERFAELDIPVSVNIDATHFFPDGQQHRYDPGEITNATASYRNLGVYSLAYVNSMVSKSYEEIYSEALSEGYFVRDRHGDPYFFHYKGAGMKPFDVGLLDMGNPSAVEWFKQKLSEPFDLGFAGYMYDYGEYLDLHAHEVSGVSGAEVHNLYPVQYQRAAYDLVVSTLSAEERARVEAGYAPDAIFYVRSAFTGSAEVTWAHWTGDPSSDFTLRSGLPAQVSAMLSAGLGGLAYSGSDIGGFVWTHPPSLELWARWAQLGAVSGIMREQLGGTSLLGHAKHSIHAHPGGTAIWRKQAKLRTALFPYLYTAAHAARAEGLPLMRHHILAFPRDAEAVAQDHQFMLGPDLLCAPVVAEGVDSQRVWLPEGASWFDVSSSARFDVADGRFRLACGEGEGRAVAGGAYATVAAPLDGVAPAFARAGSIIATLDPAVDSLADTAASPKVVALSDRSRILHLWVFPTNDTAARRGEADEEEEEEEQKERLFSAKGATWDGLEVSLETVSAAAALLRMRGTDPLERTVVAQVVLGAAAAAAVESVSDAGTRAPLPRSTDGWRALVAYEGAGAGDRGSAWSADADAGVLWLRLSPETLERGVDFRLAHAPAPVTATLR